MKRMPDSEKTPTDLWGGRHPQLGKISILPSCGDERVIYIAQLYIREIFEILIVK